jgi:hypothetical protein
MITMEFNTGVNKQNSLKLRGFSNMLTQNSGNVSSGGNILNTNTSGVVKPDDFVKSLLSKGSTTTKINQNSAITRKGGVKNIGGGLKYSDKNTPMIIKMPSLSGNSGEYVKKIKKVVGGEAPDIKDFKNMSKVKMLKLKREQKMNEKSGNYQKAVENTRSIVKPLVEKSTLSHRIDTTPNVSENKLMSGLADNKFAQMFLGSSRPNTVPMKRVQSNNVVPGYSTQGFNPSQGKPSNTQMDKNPVMNGVNERLRRLNGML